MRMRSEACTGSFAPCNGSRMKGLGVGGIQRERQSQPPDQALSQLGQQAGFIHQGCAHIDVQYPGPGLHLLVGQLQSRVKAAFLQFLGEHFFACGIDALADNHQGFARADAHQL